MLDRKIVINELRKRGYIAEEKNVVKNGVLCDGIFICRKQKWRTKKFRAFLV